MRNVLNAADRIDHRLNSCMIDAGTNMIDPADVCYLRENVCYLRADVCYLRAAAYYLRADACYLRADACTLSVAN